MCIPLITLASHQVNTSQEKSISHHGTALVYHLDTKNNNINTVTLSGGKMSV